MMHTARRRTIVGLNCVVICLVAATLNGCNRMRTEEEAVEQYYKKNPSAQKTRVPVGKLAGRVSIDGQPPAEDLKVFVVLSDPEHLEKPGPAPDNFAECDPQGNFAFTTYFTGDGVPCKKYVLTFVELHPEKRPMHVAHSPRPQRNFAGPDELKNLYNDPEKNKNDSTLVLDVQAPGRTDYEFNLSVAGKDPVKTPGQYAVTGMRLGG